MPYIVVLTWYYGPYDGYSTPFAVAIQARDLDKAREKAQGLADNRTRERGTACEVLAVFDALAGAIGPDVQKEYD